VGKGVVRAVFLDRDGVITDPVIVAGKPLAPDSVAQLRIIPEARYLLERLRERGFLLVVVTNQPDVARGTLSQAEVDRMHEVLRNALPLDEIVACCHDDSDVCECRKPQPGMLLDAARRHGIELESSFLVGDRWKDIDAGAAAGCHTILIDRGYHEQGPSHEPDAVVDSLGEAVEWILSQTSE
jgi:D-glycero-D-manno-heptose 1,7-bisphosphate phosphatase